MRRFLLDGPFTEEVKWRVPCYSLDGKNVAFIGPMKSSCVLSFVKGALLKDPERILIQQTEQSQSVRVIRFANLAEIQRFEPTIRAYIAEAVEVERAGLKVAMKTIDEFAVPQELQAKLDENPKLKAAFKALTPGRQRAYLMHVGGAKQSKTRIARVEKWTPHILKGKGIDDE